MADKRFSVLVDSLDYCLECGKPHPHKHEVFFGTSKREKSIKYGYVIPLCYEHHEGNNSPHRNRVVDLRYKRMAQEHFERNYGSREDFIREFNKSYL